MTIFEKVKAGIGAKEAAERYGLEVDRYRNASCPFHNDRHPSLYVDDDHYHCFACGEHGDVIDLTAKLFDLSLCDAVYKLAYDFSITQDKPLDKSVPEKQNRKSEAQQLREAEELCFAALMADRKLLQMQWQQHRPKIPREYHCKKLVSRKVRVQFSLFTFLFSQGALFSCIREQGL